MIRLCTDAATLNAVPADTVPGLKLRGLLAAYGTGWDFLPFWQDEQGGAGGRLSGTAVACPTPDTREEWACFLAMQPDVRQVETDPDTAACLIPLGFKAIYRPVLALPALEAAPLTDAPPLSALYPLLTEVFGKNALPPFDVWYTDISHRLRHGCGRAAGVLRDSRLCSCALVTAECEDAGLISGVATHPDYRGQGLAKTTVAALANALRAEGKRACICPKNEAADRLYRRWGAVETGTLAILTRE
ncbi:MAG: GNAT family N-acetyltransferase [Clostridia bacterium]|nr:GNAT family N-acetyltransferase [Clostridia bacterium]